MAKSKKATDDDCAGPLLTFSVSNDLKRQVQLLAVLMNTKVTRICRQAIAEYCLAHSEAVNIMATAQEQAQRLVL